MLFNSYVFIFAFLPITLFLYFYLNHRKLVKSAKIFLVVASLFFYSWWNIAYLPLIVLSMLFNYVIGNKLANYSETKRSGKRQILTFGVVCNLLLLGYFKYADFFIQNVNTIFKTEFSLLHLVLPLAISFFTFQQIAYLVDSYKNETKEYNAYNYSLFVTFFPQLIAGPIVHHKEMMPQFEKLSNNIFSHKNFARGFYLFTLGLFKKVIIADSFAPWANMGFDTAESLNMLEAWATSLSYTFQLYFDFSGYTDMALGVALLFNINLPINFDSPYQALSIQDFWRRWHITLSRFLKDYIYIPLGGNRRGELRVYLNLMITFLLGGLWHGAGWTFVFWGFLHGIALVLNRLWANLGFKLNTVVAWLITFNFVNIAWVFFRAKSWEDAMKVLNGMFTGKIVLPAEGSRLLSFLANYGVEFGAGLQKIGPNKEISIGIVAAFIIILVFRNTNYLSENFKPNSYRLILISILFVYSVIAFLTVKSEFLYFDF